MGIGSSSPQWTASDIPDQSNRVILITGGNAGLGYASAEHFMRHGARVVIACRSQERAEEAVASLTALQLPGSVEYQLLDLADLEQVKIAAADITSRLDRLDVLLLNAGVMKPPYSTTKQGLELQFGVNHIGHFALTLQLLPLLKSTSGSRVVCVSSLAHKYSTGLDFTELKTRAGGYDPWTTYADSKLCNLLFARRLQGLLDAQGASSPMVLTTNPGYVATDLHKTSVSRYFNWVARGPSEGCLAQVRASVDASAKKLEYYTPTGFRGTCDPAPGPVTDYAKDDDQAQQLWTLSEELTGLSYE